MPKRRRITRLCSSRRYSLKELRPRIPSYIPFNSITTEYSCSHITRVSDHEISTSNICMHRAQQPPANLMGRFAAFQRTFQPSLAIIDGSEKVLDSRLLMMHKEGEEKTSCEKSIKLSHQSIESFLAFFLNLHYITRTRTLQQKDLLAPVSRRKRRAVGEVTIEVCPSAAAEA